MNLAEIQRTLTNNPQATELINAVKDLKPVKQQNYKGSMEYLAADNASYCQLIAHNPMQPIPQVPWESNDISGWWVVGMTGALTFLLTLKYLGFSRRK